MMPEVLSQRTETSVRVAAPISIRDLLGGVIPPRSGSRLDEYARLANSLLLPIIIDDVSSGATEYIFVAPPLRGMEINGLFHFAAPSKSFGYDTNDIRSDWTELFDNPDHRRRLEAHRRIPGWMQFEERRLQILGAIVNDQINFEKGLPANSSDLLTPVIHLKKKKDGRISWVFAPLDAGLVIEILEKYPEFGENPDIFLPVLGPVLVAAYSPNITKMWANLDGQRGYTGKYLTSRNESTQDMGATQVLPLSIGLAPELIGTPLMINLLNYSDTGEIPKQFEKIEIIRPTIPRETSLDELYPNKMDVIPSPSFLQNAFDENWPPDQYTSFLEEESPYEYQGIKPISPTTVKKFEQIYKPNNEKKWEKLVSNLIAISGSEKAWANLFSTWGLSDIVENK